MFRNEAPALLFSEHCAVCKLNRFLFIIVVKQTVLNVSCRMNAGTGLLATIGVCYNGLQLSLIWTWGKS